MRTRELRIGNFVEYQRNDILTELKQVKGVDWGGDSIFIEYYSQDGSQYPINKKHFKPIPLTEEWLVKFGFKIDEYKGFDRGSHNVVYSIGSFNIAIEDDNFYLWFEVDEDNWYNVKSVKVDFVHQLQNLYFALTQEELKIK